MENIQNAGESFSQEQVSGGSQRNYKKSGALASLAALVIFLSAGGIFLAGRTGNTNPPKEVSQSPQNTFIANSTLVYGYWTKTSSVITALDLSTGKEADIASLANNVKHVKILSSNSLLYINNTDVHDYGKELTLRAIDTKTDKTVISADENFGIDDYMVSPNGQYAAVWMVGNSENTRFSGSPSRVYTVNIDTLEKHLIYDESSSNGQNVHYPIAVTNTGELFADRFLPNSGAGWGYGMSVSDFAGTVKKDIDVMQNGTYSSQPTVSPDGGFLAFAGYDGSDGTTVVDGFRKAMVNPNTVELFNLQNQTRSKVNTGITGALYPLVKWDKNSGKLIFQAVTKQAGAVVSDMYTYSTSGIISKLPDNTLDFYAVLDDKNDLFVQKFPGDSGVGNLGDRYSQGINKLSVLHTDSSQQEEVPLNQAPIQLISVLPSRYFPVVGEKGLIMASSKDQLQLETFEIKPTIAQKREERQSTVPQPPTTPSTPTVPDLPLCRTISYPQCNALLGTNYPVDKDIGDIGDPAFSDCVWKVQTQGEAKSTCMDSPLYLYGKNGTQVSVWIDTSVSNPNVLMDNNVIDATLGKRGAIHVSGATVDNISFDYISRIEKLPVPSNGIVVNRENARSEITKLTARIGLNERETKDVTDFAQSINAPYLFVSFYDQETSQNILPLYFNPKPDTYRNIVFYFKKLSSLPAVLPAKPLIDPIVRNGFTAIEISFAIR